jgi:hypothetical protein
MPNLEILVIAVGEGDFHQATNAIDITQFACHKLKEITMSKDSPNHMVATVGKYCTDLESLCFDTRNIDDDDLRSVSQCTKLRKISLRTPNPFTHGLSYLTNLPLLQQMELHYSIGAEITTQLLIDFSQHCPLLKTIRVSDWSMRRGAGDPRPFEDKDVAELFAAGDELRAYFEPRGSTPLPAVLDEYIIRVDRLRKDRTQ